MKRTLLLNLLVLCVLVTVVEGASSLVIAYRDRAAAEAPVYVAEKVHTKYDSLLGWVNISGIRVNDMYGHGVYLQTNGQGFRNRTDFAKAVPPGKRRAICSGDSFTLGYGVSNDETWCHLLGELDPQLQTVNMGQGGYGVGQAYLWYQRDGRKLDHQLTLFAFITTDFYRLQLSRFHGYQKPLLAVEDGKLVAKNVPVPKMTGVRHNRSGIVAFVSGLRTLDLLKRLYWKFKGRGSADGVLGQEEREVVRKLIDNLKAMNGSQGSRLVLVHLPTAQDYKDADVHSKLLRGTLAEIAKRAGILYLDLTEDMNRLPSRFDVDRLFLYGNEHYSVAGNRFIAEALYKRLREAGALPGG